MKDPNDKQTADLLRAPSATRQARMKARREAAGYRHSTIWIHGDSEERGREVGLSGALPLPAPVGVDVADWPSYLLGWEKGHGQQLVSTQCANCGDVKPVPLLDAYTWEGQELGPWYCSRRCEREALED